MLERGLINGIWRSRISGWVRVCEVGANPPSIQVFYDGKLIQTGLADHQLVDLDRGPQLFRFDLKLEHPFTSSALTSGRLAVIAKDESGEVALACNRVLATAGQLEDAINEDTAAALMYIEADRLQLLKGALQTKLDLGSKSAETVSCKSEDEAAISGRNGYVFLYQGTNRLLELYGQSEADPLLRESWQSLMSSRVSRARDLRVGLAQLMIPEKSSLVPHLVPYEVSGPSPIWRATLVDMEQRASIGGLGLINGFNVLAASPAPEATFRMLDSHLSSYGCEMLINALLHLTTTNTASLSYSHGPAQWRRNSGDLGAKFAPGQLCIPAGSYRVWSGLLNADGNPLVPELISSFDPPEGYIGIQRAWRCEGAPLQKKVVCFGNSFFARGESSTNLSWWCARLFSEFHFIFSPAIDWDCVEGTGPDWVICQTIERFMRIVPKS
jgi:hypothetical protein